MRGNLNSSLWSDTMELIRKCHLSTLNPSSANESDWIKAFKLLTECIIDERKSNPTFAKEFSELTSQTGNEYGFEDILEEYFDHLEEHSEWDLVIDSCETMIDLFAWQTKFPSEYLFRKGNALEKSKRFEEALAFGKQWLQEYPEDLYAAASNVFLLVELGKIKEAEELTSKYLHEELICNDDTDTFFMAAIRLFEITENVNAKQRVEKKIAEYNAMINK